MVSAVLYYHQHMTGYEGYSPIPKMHLACHLVRRVDYLGNPRLYATWADESANKTLKLSCRGASQITFEKTVLSRMHVVLDS